jgi:hypothetical protein
MCPECPAATFLIGCTDQARPSSTLTDARDGIPDRAPQDFAVLSLGSNFCGPQESPDDDSRARRDFRASANESDDDLRNLSPAH